MTDKLPAMLLVGHGSRDATGVAQFREFVGRVAGRVRDRGIAVEGGFIELSSPPLTDAVAALVSAGHDEVGAVPVMLVAAGHTKGDVPAALVRETIRHPSFRYRYGRPLGPHPTLLALLTERLDTVLDPADRAVAHVVLIGRGSTDPDANAEVAKVARLMFEGRGIANVEAGYVSLAEPDVAGALTRCRLLGARRVVVLPYFLFGGVLPDRIVEQANAWAHDHPGVEVRCADVIGDCEPLADLVIERYDEALIGDLRMNCDTCMYRVAMPGFADRVGVQQTPHHHPADNGHHHRPDHGQHHDDNHHPQDTDAHVHASRDH